jgi:hypothetical protein
LVIQRLLVPDDVFVDVGAHIGVDTLAAAHVLRVQGKIFAFESSASNRFLLAKSVDMNGVTRAVDVREEDLTNVRLDNVLAEKHRVSLMKVDAAGAEIEVINGSRLLIAANPGIALIVKISKSGNSVDQVILQGQSLGLVYRMINRTTGELADAGNHSTDDHGPVYLILARRESGAWSKLGVKHG